MHTTKLPRWATACALALVALQLVSPAPAARAQRASAAPEATVVFSVERYEAEAALDPVVVIRGGRYASPPMGGETKAEMNAYQSFIRNFYRPGRKYRLLFGGGEAGGVEVVKYQEPGCVGLTASARAETSVRLGGEVKALATNSPALGKGKGTRRAPTEAERASALELARRSFRRNKVGEARVGRMKVNNLTAVDLNADGRAELVGSFIVEGEFGVEEALLLVAEPGVDDYAVTLDWFHRGQEADSSYRRLVDALDLDGDKTAELIVQGLYYESHDYFIYKRERGAWRAVYQGGGGGC